MSLIKQSFCLADRTPFDFEKQKQSFCLSDLKGPYYSRPRYVTFDEQQKSLKQGFTSDLEINNAIENKFIKRLNLLSATSELFNPITESQRKNTKELVDAQERARAELVVGKLRFDSPCD